MVVAGEVGQQRQHGGVGGTQAVQQHHRRRVDRARLQVGGARPECGDLPGQRAGDQVHLRGERPAELQHGRQAAPDLHGAAQERLDPAAAAQQQVLQGAGVGADTAGGVWGEPVGDGEHPVVDVHGPPPAVHHLQRHSGPGAREHRVRQVARQVLRQRGRGVDPHPPGCCGHPGTVAVQPCRGGAACPGVTNPGRFAMRSAPVADRPGRTRCCAGPTRHLPGVPGSATPSPGRFRPRRPPRPR